MGVQQLTKSIPLMIPSIEEEDITAVSDVLRSGMLVQGKHVEMLEKTFAAYTGSRYAVVVSNGTATMHLSLLSCGVGPGDEVIVPAFSYVATANVVELTGATPVFVDIQPGTFNIDASKIEAAITPRTKAIIPVHEFGLACDISAVCEIARRHNLFVIEDAACAVGATEDGQKTGTFGTFGSFSLHPRKSITSGEGGVITTNDEKLDHTLRVLRNHGIDPLQKKMDFIMAGFNYRMTEFQAALVHSQFARLDNIIARKQQLASLYFKHLQHEAIMLPEVPQGKVHTWQTFHIVIDSSIDRDLVIAKLKENNIGSNYGAQCIPMQTFYKEKYALDCHKLYPNSLKVYQQGLAIPMYDKLQDDDIEYISNTLKQIVDNVRK